MCTPACDWIVVVSTDSVTSLEPWRQVDVKFVGKKSSWSPEPASAGACQSGSTSPADSVVSET